MSEKILLETHDLKKYFTTHAGILHAVDGIDLKLKGTVVNNSSQIWDTAVDGSTRTNELSR